jgi:pimeloyl-ACP methyl ester carboxylesterase
VYLGIHLFKHLVSLLVQSLGFEKHTFDVQFDEDRDTNKGQRFSYWLRDASKKMKEEGEEEVEEETSPIILFHGIGTGISSYGVLLKALVSAYPKSSIIVVELPLVAMERPWSEHWAATATAGEETLCKPVMQMLRRHNFLPESECDQQQGQETATGANHRHSNRHKYPVIMGHSFGCFACRWLLNYEPLAKRLAGCVLLDPMVFLLPFPDISKRLQAPCHTFYQFLVRRLIMREPSVAYALNRKSKWPKCCLWEEDVRKVKGENKKIKFEVALSRHDCFFDTELVASYLDQVKSSLSNEDNSTGIDAADGDSYGDGSSSSSCLSWLDHQTYECTHGEMIFRPDLLAHVVKLVNNVIS